MFITFEGIDGAGKSTQASLLKKELEHLKYKVFLTREPGGSKTGEKIREILVTDNLDPISEFLLFASDRRMHVHDVIKPKLQEGFIVISDRFIDSSVAYQGYGRGVSIDFINDVHNFILEGVVPDLTFLIDITPATSFARLKDIDRIEKMGVEFLKIVREGYLTLAEKEKRFIVIDGEMEASMILKLILEKTLSVLR